MTKDRGRWRDYGMPYLHEFIDHSNRNLSFILNFKSKSSIHIHDIRLIRIKNLSMIRCNFILTPDRETIRFSSIFCTGFAHQKFLFVRFLGVAAAAAI